MSTGQSRSILRSVYVHIDVGSRSICRMLTKLRGGIAELRIVTGGWHGLRREREFARDVYLRQCTMRFTMF